MSDQVWYVICVIGSLAIIVFANRFVPILRDIPASGVTPGQRVPYSLARVQMAFWTAVIVGSLIYVYWIVGDGKGNFPTLDANLVVLIGISGATGVVAAAIDIGKDATVEGAEAEFAGTGEALRALDAQILAVANAPGTAASDPTLAKLFADRAAKMEELTRQQKAMSRSKRADDTGLDAKAQETKLLHEKPSRMYRGFDYITRFFKELLEDQNGNSLHRLQLVMFTAIYGAYVLWHVATATDPSKALDANLLNNEALALMGISSGVYVGFKIPGKAN
jgi:hypothetical protein